jgi:alkylation response protein AidB-like acyl-CoA dehydrogenase
MNFDFSDDLKQPRDQARRFLSEQCPPALARRALDGEAPYAAALWREIANMGWIDAAIPERYGGPGLGYEGLCVLAEEVGRAVAPVPFASCAYLAAEAILLAGSEAQKQRYLPGLADGSVIGCVALAEGNGNPAPETIKARLRGGKLTGVKWPVADGGARPDVDDLVSLSRSLTIDGNRRFGTPPCAKGSRSGTRVRRALSSPNSAP